MRLLEKVSKSSDILRQLDLAFQSYRCSKHIDVNESAIADFKTVLDVTAHEVSLAFEAITTGEIELHLDTNIFADAADIPKSPNGGQSSSSNAADSAHDRKSSRTSSAWSLVPRDSPSQGSTSDAPSVQSENRVDRFLSEDKEVYDLAGAYLHTSSTSTSAAEPRPSLDWRSPFASIDPLSISIEQASSMILTPDDDFTLSAVRSRSGTGSTIFVDTQPVDNVEKSQKQAKAESVSTATEQGTAKANRVHEGLGQEASRSLNDTGSQYSLGGTTTLRSGEPASPRQRRASKSGQPSPPSTPRRSSEARSDSSHLSPRFSAREFGRRSRNNSLASITETDKGDEITSELKKDAQDGDQSPNLEDERPAPATEEVEQDAQHGPSMIAESATTSGEEYEDLSASIETAFADRDAQAANSQTPPPLPSKDELPEPDKTQPEVEQSPSMPTRRPPPPPKPRRSTTRARASAYRIVNTTSSDGSSSDDELYSTSKPTSPTLRTSSTQVQILATDIPRVSVDTSACEDGVASGHDSGDITEEDVGIDSVSQSEGAPNSLGIHLSPEDADVKQTADDDNSTSELIPQNGPEDLSRTITTPERPPPRLMNDPLSMSLSQDTSRQTHEDTIRMEKPPPIPRRPTRTRYHSVALGQTMRPVPATTWTSPAAIPQDSVATMDEKELVPETGLELHQDKLEVHSRSQNLRERISIDAALNVRSPSVATQSMGTIRSSDRRFRAASTSQIDSVRPENPDTGFGGFYAPGMDSTHPSELEKERINHIVHFWNNCAWDQVEAYLMDYLKTLVENDSPARARRVRHLLGVCLSFKGDWSRAIPFFLSAMRTPIRDISEIDDGDCAAAYWLGDTYSLLNRRTEALLAYCVAEHSSLFLDPAEPVLDELISAEQEAVQLGVSKDDFKMRWAQETFNNTSSSGDSILDTNVITTATATMLLEYEPRKLRRAAGGTASNSSFQLDQNRARSNSLFWLNKLPRVGKFHRMKIWASHFEPDTIWPMMFDPLFVMANVQRGRLLAYESDLLAVFTSNTEARIAKSGPMGLSRMDCFTCTDLTWLIRTIRECLRMLEMEFSEVANVEGSWFVVRSSFMQNKIATTHYFSIALFKQTFRGGYGVDICPDGICSARIIRTDYEHDKGVHNTESKRIKKLIREYLDEAAKQLPKAKRKVSYAGTPPAAHAIIPPPIPPRPRTYM